VGAREQTGADFLNSEIGRIFVAGCIMLLLWVCATAALWRVHHPWTMDIVTMGFAHVVAGKAVSIAQATAVGMPGWLVATLAAYADMLTLLLFYPLLVFAYENLVEKRFFQRHVRPVFESAQRGLGRIGRFKIAGLFLFVFFPLWMTGLLVGSVVGYLMGMRHWVNMGTISAATTASVVCWVYAYEVLFRWLPRINEDVVRILVAVLLVSLLAGRLYRKWRQAARG
jgi:uncharacterized membrane protein